MWRVIASRRVWGRGGSRRGVGSGRVVALWVVWSWVGRRRPVGHQFAARTRAKAASRLGVQGQLVEAQDEVVAAAHEHGGDVGDPVTDRFGFGSGEVVVEAVPSGSRREGRRR